MVHGVARWCAVVRGGVPTLHAARDFFARPLARGDGRVQCRLHQPRTARQCPLKQGGER
jgi:hypothetical protein